MMTSPAPATAAQSERLAHATPASRNRVVDAARALAMTAVVFGHWLVAMPVRTASGGIGGINALESHVVFQCLTWLFQVMPLVFVVGGFANAASLASSRAASASDRQWVAGRLRRLLKPTVVFAAFWGVLRLLTPGVGLTSAAAKVAAVPLWFLAVYVVVVAAQPVVDGMWQRHRAATLGGLLLLAAVGDAAQLAPQFGWFAWLNHLWVFAACQQLGVLWFEGRLPSGRRALAFASGALMAAVALVAFGPWPRSLVHIAGQRMSNAHPPTVVVFLMGVAQVCVVRAFERRAATVLERPRVWMIVAVVNLRMMTIYLWHFTALVVGSVAALAAGFEPGRSIGSAGWWLGRPLWLSFLMAILTGIVWLVGRFETGGRGSAHPAVLAVMVPAMSWTVFHVTRFGATAAMAGLLLAADMALAQTAGRPTETRRSRSGRRTWSRRPRRV
jgi:fucose 4-O-acetylase-like acetyltransferase